MFVETQQVGGKQPGSFFFGVMNSQSVGERLCVGASKVNPSLEVPPLFNSSH